jgi:hypothetical protein
MKKTASEFADDDVRACGVSVGSSSAKKFVSEVYHCVYEIPMQN